MSYSEEQQRSYAAMEWKMGEAEKIRKSLKGKKCPVHNKKAYASEVWEEDYEVNIYISKYCCKEYALEIYKIFKEDDIFDHVIIEGLESKAASKPMPHMIEYQNRVVFFFDILGFREMIDSNVASKGSDCTAIHEVFELINNFYIEEIDEKYSQSKEITFFSDSVIISFVEEEQEQIFHTLADIQILLVNLVWKGVVMRGAVSYGKLFHDKKYLFGPAFVEAYLTETKKAKYPRIICEESIIRLSQKGQTASDVKQDMEAFVLVVQPDDDEYWYIDYFGGIDSLFNDNWEHVHYLLRLKELIVGNIEKSKEPGILEKYEWMKRKYNDVVSDILARSQSMSKSVLKSYLLQLSVIP